MYTRPAQSAVDVRRDALVPAVVSVSELIGRGWTHGAIRAQVAAGRWQRCGRAVVLHNGVAHPDERNAVALLNCGPRAALTAFTLAECLGLQGWHRDAIHVLVPGGARVVRPEGLPLRIHWSSDWTGEAVSSGRHALAPAVALAAATFNKPRPAVGILAAAVQQRLTTVDRLRAAVEGSPRLRHRRTLLLALDDIGQGAHALTEIDFARLCRRHGLPEPERQAIRADHLGRRRYLDAEWRTRSGRRLIAEVDGAMHMGFETWTADQLRQNELVLAGREHIVLRIPSVIMRCEPEIVVDQLRRALEA
jgi:hypothetical protein